MQKITERKLLTCKEAVVGEPGWYDQGSWRRRTLLPVSCQRMKFEYAHSTSSEHIEGGSKNKVEAQESGRKWWGGTAKKNQGWQRHLQVHCKRPKSDLGHSRSPEQDAADARGSGCKNLRWGGTAGKKNRRRRRGPTRRVQWWLGI